ncbi:MAG: barstar family protein [Azoarcus sp.]|jgi:RNAse (barnase) inhibitor barstar|nr:barstar family protein [Azoarcus sp.]MDD2873647.1 barstar family protein [Azoarcus sp.]MDX9838302.1 barstar family protein [Azoarcus sp.]
MSTPTAPLPLSTLLADISRAGVRPLPPGSAERLAAAASQIGFNCARIDLGDCEDKAALLTRIATALKFPRWFGHNWDALADCLGDLDWLPAKGYVLLLEHAGSFRERHSEDFETLLAILRECARTRADEQIAFWAFADLSGPEPA